MGILDAPNITGAQAAAYVTAANTAASNALASAQTATQQAAVVAATNRIYATTTAGITATTPGQYFYTPAGVSGQSLTLYLNNSGTAQSITTMPDYTTVSPTVLATTTSLPTLRPSLNLDFSKAENINGLLSSRTATASKINRAQNLVTTLGNTTQAGRIDHDPLTGSSLGILLEDSYSQILKYTEDFTQTYWSKTAIGLGATMNPLGSLFNLTKLVPDTTTGVHSVSISTFSGPVITIGNKYIVSIFGMAAEYSSANVVIGPPGCFPSAISATLNFSTGSVTASSGITSPSATQYKNGVFRFRFQTAAATNSANLTVSIQVLNGALASSYTGDGASGLYIGGVNATVSAAAPTSLPQSYVPVAAGSGVRDADIVTLPLADWFNSTEGTFIIEHDCPSGVPLLQTNSTVFLTSVGAGRTALTYNASGTSIVQAGGAPTTSAVPITFGTTILPIPVGRGVAHCKRIIYYSKALPTLQLQSLTSI